MTKHIAFSLIILLLLPAAAMAADKESVRPHWSLELKGGVFYPDINNWETYYGSDKTPHYAGGIAYKIFRQMELGIEGGYIRDKGMGDGSFHTSPVGEVTREYFPLHAFVLFRGIISEDQWLVPYVGGGWTRIYYRDEVKYQDTIKGSTDGYHGRAGIQLLLDGLDESAANGLFLDYGIHHTYLFFEAQVSQALINTTTGESVNLGGTSFLAGLLFEF